MRAVAHNSRILLARGAGGDMFPLWPGSVDHKMQEL